MAHVPLVDPPTEWFQSSTPGTPRVGSVATSSPSMWHRTTLGSSGFRSAGHSRTTRVGPAGPASGEAVGCRRRAARGVCLGEDVARTGSLPLDMPRAGFEVISEIEPATKPDLTAVRHQVGVLAPVSDAFLIPDNHLGRATVSSLAVAHEVASMGVRSIACCNSRDRNRLGFRRDLFPHVAAYGVDEFLCVFGDDPASGAAPTTSTSGPCWRRSARLAAPLPSTATGRSGSVSPAGRRRCRRGSGRPTSASCRPASISAPSCGGGRTRVRRKGVCGSSGRRRTRDGKNAGRGDQRDRPSGGPPRPARVGPGRRGAPSLRPHEKNPSERGVSTGPSGPGRPISHRGRPSRSPGVAQKPPNVSLDGTAGIG